MDCPTCEALVDAYVDGELSATDSADFENALQTCAGCRRRLEAARAVSGLLRELPADRAPDLLRARIERELRGIARPSRGAVPGQKVRWTAMAASVIVALGLGWLGGDYTGQRGRDTDELVSGFLRVASSEHPVDVVSSDRHTVKPWFAGRIDYSPPVYDLTTGGFPLLGGRLDVFDGRKVSVLVYGHNQHKVALTLWPAGSSTSTSANVMRRDGFSLGEWRHGGFEMRAVSDVDANEMASFARAVDKAIDEDH